MKNSKEMPYEKVKELSTSFREAIENVDIGKLTVCDLTVCDFFRDFPRGRCGDASELLAKYLLENGIKAIYVSGVNGERTHAWLEYCDYIIDITADQFKENDTKVLVTKDKRFNDEFKEQNRYYPDIDSVDMYNKKRLGVIYKIIIEEISTWFVSKSGKV